MNDFHSSGRPKVREILDWAVTEAGAPSLAVRIQDGDGVWFGSAGLADPLTGARRVPGEQLNVGSIAKGFTAATVLTLAAEGRLTLEDTVEHWLPGSMDDSPYDATKITIRQLLANTSGLFATGMAKKFQRRVNIRSGFLKHRFDAWERQDVLRVALSEPPVGRPGERFFYSNGGFNFAAAIVEQVTGNTFESEVDRAVVRPLGLAGTFARDRCETGYRGRHPRLFSKVFLREGVQPEEVTPDNWQTKMEDPALPPLDTTECSNSWAFGAGDVVSTLDDVTSFLRAMITGDLLPAAQHADMWTTVPTTGAHWLADTRYGLGVYELRLANGVVLRGSSGASTGTMTLAMGTVDGSHLVTAHVANDYSGFPIFDRLLAAEFGAGGLRLEG
ncbi:serine hydrolase [Crossiella sp. CA-258035]|uniref:serine hydrolase domain-containing protein n=1 Tax=Crossiella sp. CA-258035 TaxID=2981138 RepID=UPI0024BC1F70|nr:serine hydrolase domain-containing protein [Crossiella sp. CA-258035]WHT16143.1 serine hydrolase [Crossiella sp. CA-258035]